MAALTPYLEASLCSFPTSLWSSWAWPLETTHKVPLTLTWSLFPGYVQADKVLAFGRSIRIFPSPVVFLKRHPSNGCRPLPKNDARFRFIKRGSKRVKNKQKKNKNKIMVELQRFHAPVLFCNQAVGQGKRASNPISNVLFDNCVHWICIQPI